MASDSDNAEQGSAGCTPTPMDTNSMDQFETSSDLNATDEFKEPLPPSPIADECQGENQLKEEKPEIVEEKIMVTSKTTAEREGNCYCGKERNLNLIELMCANCNRWFHESCIGFQFGKLVPFIMNYIFVCKNCSTTGLESFKKCPALFPQICVTAIANLMQTSIKDGNPRTKFNRDKDIIAFIEQYWEGVTTFPKRVKQTMYSSVVRALVKETNTLFACEDSPNEGQVYSLVQPDLTMIKPNYEAMIKSGQLKVTEMGIQHGSGGTAVRRSAKRKVLEDGTVVRTGGPGRKKAGATDPGMPKLPAHGYPLEHPFNKDGYRYILAEPDPHAPFRQEFDESNDWAGKPIPGWLYRTLVPSTVLFALHDRAPQLKISDDRLTVTGDKGYSMVRATHCVSRGVWYYEVRIVDLKEGAAVRIGWAQEYANLQAPLGYDKFGYSWRSRKGTRFHESHGKHYSSGYTEGDILGFLIVLPEKKFESYVPTTYKDKPLVKFKSHLYYEEKDRVAESLKKLKVLPGSKIVFYKNGEYQGDAFMDVYAGSYFPAVSLFKNAVVQVFFGPHFAYSPSGHKDFRGMFEKAEEAICDQTLADLLYLTENEGKLRLDTYSV